VLLHLLLERPNRGSSYTCNRLEKKALFPPWQGPEQKRKQQALSLAICSVTGPAGQDHSMVGLCPPHQALASSTPSAGGFFGNFFTPRQRLRPLTFVRLLTPFPLASTNHAFAIILLFGRLFAYLRDASRKPVLHRLGSSQKQYECDLRFSLDKSSNAGFIPQVTIPAGIVMASSPEISIKRLGIYLPRIPLASGWKRTGPEWHEG
jgi:hypothetical protein